MCKHEKKWVSLNGMHKCTSHNQWIINLFLVRFWSQNILAKCTGDCIKATDLKTNIYIYIT